MRKKTATCFWAAVAIVLGAADLCPGQTAAEAAMPSGEALLSGVRESYTRIQKKFTGQLRQGFKKTPFEMALSPEHLRFRFSDPVQIVHLSVSGEHAVLKEVIDGRAAPVAAGRYGDVIRGSDVTYEDLAMRFLYWKNAEVIVDQGYDDKVKRRDCHRVRVANPDEVGRYAIVDILVDKESGALAKMIGYNAAGIDIKRFTVVDVKKFGDFWIPNGIRIETLDPERRGKSLSKTYLEILDQVD